jgi:hypothetical protein
MMTHERNLFTERCIDKAPIPPSLGTPGEGWVGALLPQSGEPPGSCDRTPSLSLPRITEGGDKRVRALSTPHSVAAKQR